MDIAGLVKGASQGEGLGNKFLTHIREVDAIVQVVRCFEDEDIHHVSGDVDPVRDIEVINTELMLADLEAVKKRRERIAKEIKRGDKSAAAEDAVLAKIEASLDAGKPALTVELTPEEKALSREFFLLSDKPTIFACNVKEADLASADENPYVVKVREYVKTHLACEAVVISAQIESELVDLEPAEAEAFSRSSACKRAAWARSSAPPITCSACAPISPPAKRKCAPGPSTPATPRRKPPASSTPISSAASSRPKPSPTTIWSECGSVAAAREKGLYRMEGKEYVVKDGDVLLFKFNV